MDFWSIDLLNTFRRSNWVLIKKSPHKNSTDVISFYSLIRLYLQFPQVYFEIMHHYTDHEKVQRILERLVVLPQIFYEFDTSTSSEVKSFLFCGNGTEWYLTARHPPLEKAKPLGYKTSHTMATCELLRMQFSQLILPDYKASVTKNL